MSRRYIAFALTLAVLLAFGALAVVSADPGAPHALSGRVKQRDATPLHSDRLVFALTGVQQPDFGSLRGYLLSDDGQQVTAIGELPVADGAISMDWDSPTGENLIGHYNTVRITKEEVYATA